MLELFSVHRVTRQLLVLSHCLVHEPSHRAVEVFHEVFEILRVGLGVDSFLAVPIHGIFHQVGWRTFGGKFLITECFQKLLRLAVYISSGKVNEFGGKTKQNIDVGDLSDVGQTVLGHIFGFKDPSFNFSLSD